MLRATYDALQYTTTYLRLPEVLYELPRRVPCTARGSSPPARAAAGPRRAPRGSPRARHRASAASSQPRGGDARCAMFEKVLRVVFVGPERLKGALRSVRSAAGRLSLRSAYHRFL